MNWDKFKKFARLIKGRRFFPAIGLLTNKIIGTNYYIKYLRHNVDVDNHIPYTVDGITIFLSPDDEGISHHIFHFGEWESKSGSIFFDTLQQTRDKSDSKLSFLDIGANRGYYSLQAAELLGKNCQIIAVEPEPENQTALKKGIKKNSLEERIHLKEAAIGDETKSMRLQISKRSNAHTLAEIPNSHENLYTEKSVPVEVFTADELLQSINIDPHGIDFVRLDVEGYEWEIFQGMNMILDSAKVIFVELHPHRTSHSKLREILNLLQSHNFEIIYASSSESKHMKSYAEIEKHLENSGDEFATELIVQKYN